MAKITGIMKIYANGRLFRTKPGAKFNPGGKVRTQETGHSVYGHHEEVRGSTIDCVIVHMSDTDVVEMSSLVDVTIKVETDTGQSYVMNNATVSEPCELTAGGDMTFKAFGDEAVKE